MGIMVYSLSWVMQELYHQPYEHGRDDHLERALNGTYNSGSSKGSRRLF